MTRLINRRSVVLGGAGLGLATLMPGQVLAQAGKDKRFTVFLIVWRGEEDAAKGFKDYVKSQNLPFDLVVRDAKTDAKNLPGFVAEAKAMKPDLVVTWGTTTAREVLGTHDKLDPAKHITDIPGVFMIVSDPISAKIVENFESSGRNITGTLYLVPEETQLRAASTYLPFKRLGVLRNKSEQNSVAFIETMKGLEGKLDFTLKIRDLALGPDNKPLKDSIAPLTDELVADGVDAFYQGADSFLNVNRDIFTGRALHHKLPVICAGEDPVRRSNGLLGVVNRYYTVGQLTAAKAEDILVQGKKPASIPIEAPKEFSFIINMRVARELNLYPPMQLVKIAEMIR